jgi:DNA-binding LytR/AlgR family response regulator
MDIQMGEMSGVEAGQALRNLPNGDDVIMIFISSHDSYFEELVELGSFRFIGKPVDEKKLDDVFSRAINQAMKIKTEASSLFHFKVGLERHTVRTDEIAYLKNTKRTITLFIWDREKKAVDITYKIYSTIDNIMQQLPEAAFVQCERSYIVNLGAVRSMDKDYFLLHDDNNTRIPIGKVFKLEAKKSYFKHLGVQYE